jgi:hypothetical protein
VFECLSRTPHLKDGQRIDVVCASEQFVGEAAQRDARPLYRLEGRLQELLTVVDIEFQLDDDNDFLRLHR